jgi:hypothetical protein
LRTKYPAEVGVPPHEQVMAWHRIDPDVDDARDDLLDDLMEGGRVSRLGYVAGVGAAARTAPRRNLTGDPYCADGLRILPPFGNRPFSSYAANCSSP